MISEIESKWIIEGLANVEAFKLIDGYDNYYITTRGRVYNEQTKTYLKQSISNGYLNVSLSKNGKRKHKRVHRLMAEAFISNPENKEYVDHIDRVTNNNDINNLRWATPSENGMNKSVLSSSKTGIPGVTFHKRDKKYRGQIKINGKIMSKYCDSKEEAIIWRNKMEVKHFKDFQAKLKAFLFSNRT